MTTAGNTPSVHGCRHGLRRYNLLLQIPPTVAYFLSLVLAPPIVAVQATGSSYVSVESRSTTLPQHARPEVDERAAQDRPEGKPETEDSWALRALASIPRWVGGVIVILLIIMGNIDGSMRARGSGCGCMTLPASLLSLLGGSLTITPDSTRSFWMMLGLALVGFTMAYTIPSVRAARY